MPINFDSIPFEEWDIKLDNKKLDELINDDPALTVEQLTGREKEAIDVLVVGREHGHRSADALAKIVASYKPHLIINEYSFNSEHTKNYATITANGLMFDTRSIVGALSRNIPIGGRFLGAEEYLSSIPDRDNDDIFLLLRSIRQSNPKLKPIIRIMGEADASLRSMRGGELSSAYAESDDEDALITAEAKKIIAREDIMANDISKIIANTRRKLPFDEAPRLNIIIVSGLFHAHFLHKNISKLGVSPAGITGLIALDNNVYDLNITDVSYLPTDQLLARRVGELRST